MCMAKIIPFPTPEERDTPDVTTDSEIQKAREAAHTDPEIAEVLKSLHAEFDD